ncbi:hypothetical protein K3994_003641 [Salmonella enterica]|nr:hypothetical protein [Salmonella enterica]
MKNSKAFELLKSTNTSLTITVNALSLKRKDALTPLYINKWINYDIIILLETIHTEIIVKRHIKKDKNSNIAEFSVDIDKIIVNLKKLMKQKSSFSGRKKLNSLQSWLQTTAKKASQVTFSVPLYSDKKTNEYAIHYRENTGIDIRINQSTLANCIIESGKLKNTKNYMVCIKENNKRIKRWDREIFGNETRWRACPSDKFEILGEITLSYKVTRE